MSVIAVETVVRAMRLLPPELQAQLPRLALTPTLAPDADVTWYAWYDPDARVITIDTSEAYFHDAMGGDPIAELQLAGILRHELEHHLNFSGGEVAAYDAELRFLAEHHAPPELLAWAEDAKSLGLAHEQQRQQQPTHKELSDDAH